MPFEDPWFRQGKRMSPLDFERRLYEETGNPLHVLRALQICSELMRGGVYGSDSLPEWILDYLDKAIGEVQELWNEPDQQKGVPVKIAEIFGFKRAGQGVRDTAF